MRIHRLEIQAFGPFAERQHIDFDGLTEQGLFLLNGPTGAGKSSVLDAICYALYGAVPGERQNAKRLRSDHAPDGLAPEVVCEFSAGSRRFEVTRNPAWSRPSKRGSGTTTEQAKTLLRERVAGQWVTRSTRNDEAGAELQDVLGMNREQFTRVVMLPQGEFAAFLRSDATARGELLQRLFATDRFSTVEQLLAEHAARTASALQEAEGELEDLLARAEEEVQRHGLTTQPLSPAARVQGPAAAGLDPESSETDGSGHGLLALQDQLMAAVTEGRIRVKELTAVREACRLDRSGIENERRDRIAYRRLLAEWKANEVDLQQAATLRTMLESHRGAQILEGPLQSRDEAAEQLRADQDHLQSVMLRLEADPALRHELPETLILEAEPALADIERAHDEIRERLAAARASLPLEQDLVHLGVRIRDVERTIEQQRSKTALCRTKQEEFAKELSNLGAELEVAQTVAARAAELKTQCAEVTERLELLGKAELAERALQKLDEQLQEQQMIFLAAKEDWLGKLQLRLEQTAAELAARLVPGEPCAVCGSVEHPAPATPAKPPLVSREDEEDARANQDRAEGRVRQISAERDAAALEAAMLRTRSGEFTVSEVRTALSSLEQERSQAELAVRSAAELTGRKATLEAALAGLQEENATLAQSLAEGSSRLTTLREQETTLKDRLSQVRGSYGTVVDKVAALEVTERRLGAVCSALTRTEQARAHLDKAETALRERLAVTDFPSPDAVRAALLTGRQVDEAEQSIRDAENTAHRIERDLQRPENIAAAVLEKEGGALPDEHELTLAGEREAEAGKQLDRAVLEVGLLEQSVVQLGSYTDRAALLEERLVPLRHAHQLAKSIADTARGNGENLYKMSLATYVLAARLEQVADAATERLQQMSDGRYSLVHSDSKSGNRKSGLGLNVIDSWTGMRRDTATLSGGESFMASLALALGLADVVQHETGGLDIETLFVDEGFGSLDEQSLEQVMDALENLRDGGRVVGLVSHVAELKQRIPAQLHVSKGRAGSSVSFVNQLERV